MNYINKDNDDKTKEMDDTMKNSNSTIINNYNSTYKALSIQNKILIMIQWNQIIR